MVFWDVMLCTEEPTLLYCIRNVVAHGDAREGKWRGNWRMEWVASTLTWPWNVAYPALLTLMRTPWLPAVDWTESPTDLNGLVRFGERRNLVSARVPSGSARALPICCTTHCCMPKNLILICTHRCGKVRLCVDWRICNCQL